MSSTCTRSSIGISPRKRAVAAIVVIGLAAGCGGGSGAVTAPNTPKQIATDKAVAKSAVLRSSDLPTAYKATPHKRDPANDTPKSVLRKFAACAKIPESKIADLLNGGHDPSAPSVDSPDFTFDDKESGTQFSFENTVEIDRSSKDISEPIDLLGGKDVLPCWKDLFRAAFQAEVTAPDESVGELVVSPIDIGKIGDKSVAFEVRVLFTKGTRSIKAFLDLYFVQSGRAGISLSASGIGRPIDHDLSKSLVEAVADRLKGAT